MFLELKSLLWLQSIARSKSGGEAIHSQGCILSNLIGSTCYITSTFMMPGKWLLWLLIYKVDSHITVISSPLWCKHLHYKIIKHPTYDGDVWNCAIEPLIRKNSLAWIQTWNYEPKNSPENSDQTRKCHKSQLYWNKMQRPKLALLYYCAILANKLLIVWECFWKWVCSTKNHHVSESSQPH